MGTDGKKSEVAAREAEVAAAEVAARQLGVITLAQACDSGLTPRQVERRVSRGTLQRLHRGVFAVSGSPATWEQRLLAAALAAGTDALVSHRCAGALHGLDGIRARRVEVTVKGTARATITGVVVHRTLHLESEDIARVGAIPVTSVERTLVDCSGSLSRTRLARVVDDALVRKLTSLAALRRCTARLGSASGRRIARLEAILDRRGDETSKAESTPEMRVYRAIVAAGLPVPEQQHWVTVEGERFRLDLAYPAVRLGIEYQGFDPHRSRSSFDRDYRRDRLLTGAGWTILYFTSADSNAEIVRSVQPFVT